MDLSIDAYRNVIRDNCSVYFPFSARMTVLKANVTMM